MTENWQQAYTRILGEVQKEMAGSPEYAQYVEYSRRCKQWRAEQREQESD